MVVCITFKSTIICIKALFNVFKLRGGGGDAYYQPSCMPLFWSDVICSCSGYVKRTTFSYHHIKYHLNICKNDSLRCFCIFKRQSWMGWLQNKSVVDAQLVITFYEFHSNLSSGLLYILLTDRQTVSLKQAVKILSCFPGASWEWLIRAVKRYLSRFVLLNTHSGLQRKIQVQVKFISRVLSVYSVWISRLQWIKCSPVMFVILACWQSARTLNTCWNDKLAGSRN